MLRCREISNLVSESMEHPLPLRVRMQVWMHLAMCRLCFGFVRHVRLLRRAARENPARLTADESAAAAQLSEHARARIKAALREANE